MDKLSFECDYNNGAHPEILKRAPTGPGRGFSRISELFQQPGAHKALDDLHTLADGKQGENGKICKPA